MSRKPDVARMSTKDLYDLLNRTSDDYLADEIYDELERRERAEELKDWDEQDRRAAAEERIEMWRREY